MHKQLFLVLLAIGIYSEALGADAPVPTASSEKPVKEHRSLPCPQCGDWAISNANETGVHGARIKDIDAAVGEYLHVNKNTITIPGCGSFHYKVQTTTIESPDPNNGNSEFYVISMSLKKLKVEQLCNGDDWTLKARINKNDMDDGGWGDFILASTRKGINPRSFDGWNIARTDPSAGNTSEMGEAAVFKAAQAKKTLAKSASKLHPLYERMKVEPFNVDRFSHKMETYCEQYFSSTTYNESIGEEMRECEYMILAAKQKEFASIHCNGKLATNRKCKLPSESLK
jgi:hypothetical protein